MLCSKLGIEIKASYHLQLNFNQILQSIWPTLIQTHTENGEERKGKGVLGDKFAHGAEAI